MKIAIIIPAHNEEKSIGSVLNHLPKIFHPTTVVVDNNSNDQTVPIVKNMGIAVTTESKMGYGAACLQGVRYAKENFNFDTFVFLDGDFSDHPQDIFRLIHKAKESGGADMVIGSRNLGEAEPGSLLPQAKFGNWLATSLMNLFTGSQFTDLGPFRLIKRTAYDQLNMQDENYGWTMEMQIKAIKLGLICRETSMHYKARIGQSKISGTVKGSVLAGYKILYTLFRYLVLSPMPKQQIAEKYEVL